MFIFDLPESISAHWKDFLPGLSTQAVVALVFVAALAVWSTMIWRARLRIRRRIQAAVTAYADLELSQ